MLPISFDSAVIGTATDAGNEGNGSRLGRASVGVDEPVACCHCGGRRVLHRLHRCLQIGR